MSTARLPHTSSRSDSQFRRRYNELSDQVTETVGSISTGTGDVGALQTQVTALQNGQFNSGIVVSGTSAGANIEFSITHNLGRIPQGYVVLGLSAAAVLYQLAGTGTAWTTSQIFVKSSTAAVGWKVYIS